MSKPQAGSFDTALRNLVGLLPELEALYKDVHSHPELSMQLQQGSRPNPISAKQISLQTSFINQEHRPIRLDLLAGLSFRQ